MFCIYSTESLSEQDVCSSSDDDSATDFTSLYCCSDVTSIDDISTLTPLLLLHKASTAANLRVITHALAMGVNVNEGLVEDQGKTPLIKAVESVCIS